MATLPEGGRHRLASDAAGDGLDRPQQRRHEAVGVGDDGVVLAVDAERLGARDRLEQLDLAPQRARPRRAS